MTTDVASPVSDFDTSLMNPSTWKEPKELIPVRVVKSEYRWSDDKYNAATEFRPAYPHRRSAQFPQDGSKSYGKSGNSIMQWDLQLERQDARYALINGTEAPVIIYAGIDLEKYPKNRAGQHELTGLIKGRSKENLIMAAWTKLVGSLHSDPGVIVGQFFNVEFFRQKELGPGFFAKNVAVPIAVLPPTYRFDGEVRVFQQTARASDGAESGEATTSASDFGATVPAADTAAKIAAFIRDNGVTDFGISLVQKPGFPTECRVDPFMTAMARGTLVDTLASFGQTVN